MNHTVLVILCIALAVFSHPGNKFCSLISSRLCLRIPRRNQFGQLRSNQMEGFETRGRSQRVTRRLARITKRTMAAIPRQIKIDSESTRLEKSFGLE